MVAVKESTAEAYLESRDVPFEVTLHDATQTALAEARLLHLPFDDVLKTVMLKVGSGYRMAVLPASRRLDIKLARELVGEPVRLATEDELEAHFPGFELGAIPPLPGLLKVGALVDEAVFEHDAVTFADGRRTASVTADPHRLFWGEDARIGKVTRDPLRAGWRFEGDAVDVPEEDYFG